MMIVSLKFKYPLVHDKTILFTHSGGKNILARPCKTTEWLGDNPCVMCDGRTELRIETHTIGNLPLISKMGLRRQDSLYKLIYYASTTDLQLI